MDQAGGRQKRGKYTVGYIGWIPTARYWPYGVEKKTRQGKNNGKTAFLEIQKTPVPGDNLTYVIFMTIRPRGIHMVAE